MMYRSLALAVALALPAGGALAEMKMPPATSLPISELTKRIEATIANLAAFKEISWDDDGYWEIEMFTTDGKTVDARADPVTGVVTLR